MLQERLKRVPSATILSVNTKLSENAPKTARQLLRADRFIIELQFVKHALHGERNTLVRVVVRRVHQVDGLAQLVREEERLQQRVHVARSALILQTDIARVAFRVPSTDYIT